MPSEEAVRSLPRRVLFGVLALVLLSGALILLLWPTLTGPPFDEREAYATARRSADRGEWAELEGHLWAFLEATPPPRMNADRWVAWLGLGRRLGLATGRWEALQHLVARARAELPGNDRIAAFALYARIKNTDYTELPPPPIGEGPFAILARRYLLDYHLQQYLRRQPSQGRLPPRALLASEEFTLWAHLAQAIPTEPSFAARALLTALKANRPEEFLRFLEILQSYPEPSPLFQGDLSSQVLQRLIGLAAYRLGRWEIAIGRLEGLIASSVFDRVASLALTEAYQRTGRMTAAYRMLDRHLTEASGPLELLLEAFARLALLQGRPAEARDRLNTVPHPLSLELYLRVILAQDSGSRGALLRRFVDLLSDPEAGARESYLYHAAFPETLTPTLLNDLIRRWDRPDTPQEYLEGLVGMLLWELNRQGKFELALRRAEEWESRWPGKWLPRQERALALAQLPGQGGEAYSLWLTAPPAERTVFWEYNASRLAGLQVQAQDSARDYSQALKHNHRAESLLRDLPNNPATRRFRARILVDRAVWQYYSNRQDEAVQTLRTARDLDSGYLESLGFLDIGIRGSP